MTYTVRRSRASLFIGYFLAEGTLVALLACMLVIWRDEPAYMDWPLAMASWVVVALFFHALLFIGSFYSVWVNGEAIAYRAFLRKTKRLTFANIRNATPSIGVDVKIVGNNGKTLFYVKRTDRNADRFLMDVSARAEGDVSG